MQYFQGEEILTTFKSLIPLMEAHFGSRVSEREKSNILVNRLSGFILHPIPGSHS
jgi:hypothetical protein